MAVVLSVEHDDREKATAKRRMKQTKSQLLLVFWHVCRHLGILIIVVVECHFLAVFEI